jgi:hypothetical protein
MKTTLGRSGLLGLILVAATATPAVAQPAGEVFILAGLSLPDLGIDVTSADVKQYTFLVGPRFRLLSTRRHHVDVRALLGGSSLNFDVPVSVSTFKSEEFGFAAALGGSYTVVLNDVFSYRVVQ